MIINIQKEMCLIKVDQVTQSEPRYLKTKPNPSYK